MHTLDSQSLTQISIKLERERKGRRWIFNLSSTPTKGTQSPLRFCKKHGREGEGMNPSFQLQQWGMEGEEGGEPQPYPLTHRVPQQAAPALKFLVGAAWKFQCGISQTPQRLF